MKKIIIYIFSLVFILFCSVHIKIFAVISNQYNVLFDYMTTYIVNSESTIISNGNSIKYVETLDSKGTPTSLSITLGTNKKYDVEELPNNYNINSNEIEFTINCNYEIYELYLYDSFENEIITSRTNNIYADFLVDDTYLLKVILRGTGNLIDNRTYEMYQTECYYSFTIDTKKPTINGASIYMDGIYTNSTIHVLGVDELSGIKAVYMLEPNCSKYQNKGTSISLTLTKN